MPHLFLACNQSAYAPVLLYPATRSIPLYSESTPYMRKQQKLLISGIFPTLRHTLSCFELLCCPPVAAACSGYERTECLLADGLVALFFIETARGYQG